MLSLLNLTSFDPEPGMKLSNLGWKKNEETESMNGLGSISTHMTNTN